jgi:rRNA maturation RNase YbeY
MSKPTIHLHDPRWKKALRPYCKTVEGICDAVIPAKAGIHSQRKNIKRMDSRLRGSDKAISIVLSNDAEIQTLNKQYRGKNKPTNVLSFPNDDEPLGDVILAFETIEREAKEQGKVFKDHAAHLIVHGILHLMGYDHEDVKDAAKMEALEIKILAKLGIANPYL